MKTNNSLFVSIILVLIAIGCAKDNDLGDENQWNDKIRGEWFLESATRQGVATRLLDDLYFNFNDSIVEMNYPDTIAVPYKIAADTVFLDKHIFEKLEILSAENERLNMGFQYNKNYFSLVFSRKK